MRAQSGNVTIDGIEAKRGVKPDAGEQCVPHQSDNVQEFKVTTSNPTLKRRNKGLNVLWRRSRGGNDYHVMVTEAFRNTVLNANESFANRKQSANEH